MKRSPKDQVCATKKQCIEGGILSTNNSVEQGGPHNYREDALYNYVVMLNPLYIFLTLRHIFGFLKPQELERCWHVNRFWRAVADPLIYLHYDVQVRAEHNPTRRRNSVTLTKRARTNTKSKKRFSLSFPAAIKALEKVLPLNNDKLILTLKIEFDIADRPKNVEDFLTRFGSFIENIDLASEQTVDVIGFSHFLLTWCPNVKTLNLSSLRLTDTMNFIPDSPQYKLTKLAKISVGNCKVSSETFEKFLTIATNLEEIDKLPIWLINAVEVAGKGQFLKTVDYHDRDLEPFTQNRLTVLTAFKKLADLQPKLSSFSFLPSTAPFEPRTSVEMIRPFVLSILQSSAQSLEELVKIELGNWFDFTTLPQLKNVKRLVFKSPPPNERCLSSDISLSEKFPSVVEISMSLYLEDQNSTNWFFPEISQFPGWGCQIKRLCLFFFHYTSVPGLALMFPLIEDFEFVGSADEIGEILPELAKSRLPLKSLKINIPIFGKNGFTQRPGILDCAFTGLSPKVVAKLSDPLKRKTIKAAQIRRFKRESTISKFKGLKKLTLGLYNKMDEYWRDSEKCYTTLTRLTSDFGFKSLPELKVSVHLWKTDRTWKAIKKTLEPLARSNSNVEIVG